MLVLLVCARISVCVAERKCAAFEYLCVAVYLLGQERRLTACLHTATATMRVDGCRGSSKAAEASSLSGGGAFTADDVALLGHSSSKSKTIVSCLHKLGRATLQRAATGGNVYTLC